MRSPGEFRRTERRPREAHRGKIIAVREKRNGRTESDPIGTGRVAGGLRGSVVPARPTRGGPPRGAYRPVLSVRRRSTAPSHGGRSSDSIGVCRARGPDPARSPAPPDAQGTGEILGWGATITDGRVRASDRDRGRSRDARRPREYGGGTVANRTKRTTELSRRHRRRTMTSFVAAIRQRRTSYVVDTNKIFFFTGNFLCDDRRVAWRKYEG